MDHLKLVALDEEDLGIISAHVQDAVTKVGDLKFLRAEQRFVLPINRFAWERQMGRSGKTPERRNAVLHFDRVLTVQSAGIDIERRAETLVLLALAFHSGETPGGIIELLFSADATIRLGVECIETRLADLGGAWEASSKPKHDI